MNLKELLESELKQKNSHENLFSSPDPLQVASRFKDPVISLICALFAYGNAGQIVKFLNRLDYDLLNLDGEKIKKDILSKNLLYRFQTPTDVANIFITAKRLKDLDLEGIIKSGFKKDNQMIDGVNSLIKRIYKLNKFRSQGYEFFFSKVFENEPKSPYKRYNMWLRWLVRHNDIDLGLFKELPKSELILPLDTHTHKVSLALGLCDRKSYDFKAAVQITSNLKKFDPDDPIKYDFALYRIGQNKETLQKKLKLS